MKLDFKLLLTYILILSFSASFTLGTCLNTGKRIHLKDLNIKEESVLNHINNNNNNNHHHHQRVSNNYLSPQLNNVKFSSCPCCFEKYTEVKHRTIMIPRSCLTMFGSMYAQLKSLNTGERIWEGPVDDGVNPLVSIPTSVNDGFYRFEIYPGDRRYTCRTEVGFFSFIHLDTPHPHSVNLHYKFSNADAFYADIYYRESYSRTEWEYFDKVKLESTSPTLNHLKDEHQYNLTVTASRNYNGREIEAQSRSTLFSTPPTFMSLNWVYVTSVTYHGLSFFFTLGWILALGAMKYRIFKDHVTDNLISFSHLVPSDLVLGGITFNILWILQNTREMTLSNEGPVLVIPDCLLAPFPIWNFLYTMQQEGKSDWKKRLFDVLKLFAGVIFSIIWVVATIEIEDYVTTVSLAFLLLILICIIGQKTLLFCYHYTTDESETHSLLNNSSSSFSSSSIQDPESKQDEFHKDVNWEKVKFIMSLPEGIVAIALSLTSIITKQCETYLHGIEYCDSTSKTAIAPFALCILIFVIEATARFSLWIQNRRFPENYLSYNVFTRREFLMALTFISYFADFRINEQSFVNVMQMVGIHFVFIFLPQIVILSIILFIIFKKKKQFS